jgi:ABC-type transport system involved in cytochrome bd biosynthesis fused ATPase/permease subunit
MATTGSPPVLSRAELVAWRRRLLHGDWRVVDLELFQVLLALLNVATVLLAAALVVAMTRTDGNVRISVLFVAALVVGLVLIRAGARTGLHAAERRTAAMAAASARAEMLDAIGRGAPVRAGVASTFVARSAVDVGVFLSRALPARVAAAWVPVVVLTTIGLIDPLSAGIAASVALVVPAVLIVLGRRAAAEAESGLARLRSLGGRALELLDGAVELRALGAVERGTDELAAATARMVESTRRSLRLGLVSATSLDVLAAAAVGLVAMVDGFRLLDGTMGLGHGLAAVLLTVEVFAPLRAAGAAFHAGADGRAALAMLAAASAAATPRRPEPTTPLPAIASAPALVWASGVALVAVPGGPVVAGDLSFEVPAGGALVVTGPTGSGKSTLLRALMGAPLVADGELRLGNAKPAVLSPRQRSAMLSIVDQHPLVVAGTIRENLELGTSGVDLDAITDTIERCGLSPLVARSALGLDQQVGEEGRLLSAGERARLALARAVLREPGVLLLDELGAHLDDAALEGLRVTLGGFLASRTVIEAAHERPLLVSSSRLHLGSLLVAS